MGKLVDPLAPRRGGVDAVIFLEHGKGMGIDLARGARAGAFDPEAAAGQGAKEKFAEHTAGRIAGAEEENGWFDCGVRRFRLH